jgi:hypothetical protein
VEKKRKKERRITGVSQGFPAQGCLLTRLPLGLPAHSSLRSRTRLPCAPFHNRQVHCAVEEETSSVPEILCSAPLGESLLGRDIYLFGSDDYLFILVLGFEHKASYLLRQVLYHLSHLFIYLLFFFFFIFIVLLIF